MYLALFSIFKKLNMKIIYLIIFIILFIFTIIKYINIITDLKETKLHLYEANKQVAEQKLEIKILSSKLDEYEQAVIQAEKKFNEVNHKLLNERLAYQAMHDKLSNEIERKWDPQTFKGKTCSQIMNDLKQNAIRRNGRKK